MNLTRPNSPASRAATVALLVAIGLLLLFVYHVAVILGLFFISVLFALYLGGLTSFLDGKLAIGRGWGLIGALAVTAIGVTGIGWLVVPPVLQQTDELLRTLPSTAATLSDYLLDLGGQYPIVRGFLPDAIAIETQFAALRNNLGDYFANLVPYLFTGVGVFIHLVSVVVMAIYLTLNPELYVRGFVRLFPPARRPLVAEIMGELTVTLRGWIGAQMVAMVILASLTLVGLLVLQVPFALAFGVFTGIAVVVPFFGTLISTILPAAFVMGSAGTIPALLVLLLGVIVHLVEANFVHPMIMQRRIKVPPVLSIISVLVMAELFGGIGLLLAVPILATLMVVVRRAYVAELLEKHIEAPPVAAYVEDAIKGGIVLHAS